MQSGTNSKISQVVQITSSQAHEMQRNVVQSMDVAQDSIDVDKDCSLHDREIYDSKYNVSGNFRQEHCELGYRQYEFSSKRFDTTACSSSFDLFSSGTTCLDSRLGGIDDIEVSTAETLPSSWDAGWDACASEALRYLTEDEGLPLHHPTVVAMKSHLELQRERAFMQYTA